eukprot:UN07962
MHRNSDHIYNVSTSHTNVMKQYFYPSEKRNMEESSAFMKDRPTFLKDQATNTTQNIHR